MVPVRFVFVTTALFAGFATPAVAADNAESLIKRLDNSDNAETTVASLTKLGSAAVTPLKDTILKHQDIAVRGWAVLALSQIADPNIDVFFRDLQENGEVPDLVRTWAAAARVRRATTTEQLLELARLKSRFPALERPLKLRFEAMLASGGPMSADALLQMSIDVPDLRGMLTGAILAQGADAVVGTMARGKTDAVRRQAAAYLATMGQKGKLSAVERAVISTYAFQSSATETPWNGGALFVPSITWSKASGTELVDQMIRWMVFCDRKGDRGCIKQIHNNIRSLNLARAVGYNSPGWSDADLIKWLQIWSRTKGRPHAQEILKQQGVDKTERYTGAIR